MRNDRNEIRNPDWDNSWARQKPPIKVDYNDIYQYWHMHQILKRVINRDSSVLECGCAPAQWLAYFATEYNCEVCGIDNSAAGLNLSKRNLEMQGINRFRLIEGDVNHIPLDGNIFDVVFSTGLLEHFSNPMVVVKEMVRVLKPNGLLIIRIPNFHLGSLMWLMEGVLFRHGVPETQFKLNLNDVNSWLHEQNLRILNSEYIGLYVNHGRIPKAKWSLKLINRYTAHSIMAIGMKREEV